MNEAQIPSNAPRVATAAKTSADELDTRVMRRAAMLLASVLVVVGTCFAPHVFIALDAVVIGIIGYHWYGRSLRA